MCVVIHLLQCITFHFDTHGTFFDFFFSFLSFFSCFLPFGWQLVGNGLKRWARSGLPAGPVHPSNHTPEHCSGGERKEKVKIRSTEVTWISKPQNRESQSPCVGFFPPRIIFPHDLYSTHRFYHYRLTLALTVEIGLPALYFDAQVSGGPVRVWVAECRSAPGKGGARAVCPVSSEARVLQSKRQL